MTKLARAMRAAQDRKVSGVGEDKQGITVGTEFADRAIFSGFDIEYGELVATSTEVASLYTHYAHNMGLLPLFISAWCDGLLTGMMLASLPSESESGVTDDTGPESE